MTNSTLDNFIIPKKPAKRSRPESASPIQTKNTFSNLKEVTLKSVTKSQKIPPIYMKAMTHSQTISNIQKYTKNFNLKYCGNGQVRIQTHTLEDFQKLKQGLKDENNEFHSFTLNSEKPKKAVIRGLPVIELNDIKEDLNSKGFKITNIFKMKGKDGQPTKNPLYLINFDPDTDTNKIKLINNICHCKIKIEKYTTSKNITQCFRCQQFGHAAANCNMAFKCVKCAEEHPTRSCIKEAATPAKCCNCGGNHTANYKDCPAKREYKETTTTNRTITPKQTALPSTQTFLPLPSHPTQKTTTQKGLSWAQITRSPALTTEFTKPKAPKQMTSADMPISDLMQLVMKVRDLQIRLKQSTTKEERCFLIMELAATMDNV
jgi:Associated with zinc fingers